MSIKLIASDLDGTLLTDKKELSPGTRKALDMAAAQGIYIVPATGRSFESVPEMIREYPGVKYLITANGGAVYSAEAGKRIYQCLLSPESVDAAIAVRQREKIVMEAVIDGIPYAAEEAMAFGDADNDSSMLEVVKYGFAMGNATENCQKAAAYVTGTNEEDGVAEAILSFLCAGNILSHIKCEI